jgi:hypothetical protein
MSNETNLESLRIKVEAKIAVLKELDMVLHQRIEELEKTLREMEQKTKETSKPAKRPPTKRQIDYALDLARQTGFRISEQELLGMSFEEVSELIGRLVEKRKGERKNG